MPSEGICDKIKNHGWKRSDQFRNFVIKVKGGNKIWPGWYY